ncbi:Zinc finger, PMZ-type [Sesbania bispinosa]|nr:Zinc finger, PMZ-type [Sesbania bispinosa]
MAEREERNVIESDVGLNVGTACGTFFIRANNQNYHNIFPQVVHVRSRGSIRDMNLENSRALQKLTADDVFPMQFGYYEAGELFYHKYASAVGFIVRKNCIGKNKQGKVVMRRWVCNTSTRIHCPAAFCISVDRVSHEWFVREFVAEHTHELTPTCKSHHQIDPPVVNLKNAKKKGLDYNCSRAENPEITIFDGCMPLSIVTEDHKAIRKELSMCCHDHDIVYAHGISRIRLIPLLTNGPLYLTFKYACLRMYKKRHMWAETYLRGHFWGGLQSTRRVCERINQRLSMFSQHKLKLHQFINLYDKTVDYEIVCSGVNAEYESANAEFVPKTRLVKIEKHAADVYTLDSYKRFLSEMRLETLLFVLNKHDGSNHTTYKLGSYENQNLVYEVMFKPSGPSIKCSCLKFETLGFPCSHIIHVIKSERLEKIPQNLIHLRWTKTAKSTAQFWQRALPPVPSDIVTKLMRVGNLMYLFSMLCYLASQSDQEYNRVRSSLLMQLHEDKERSFARRASNSETLNSEKDEGSVSRIGRSKGSQPDDDNGEKRRKTNGEGHSRNVEVEQIKNGCLRLKLISADISVADIPVMQDKGKDLVANHR